MKTRSGSQFNFRHRLLYVAVASCFTTSIALANPVNPTVVSGGATFATAGSTLTVTNTPNTIVNWQQFGINNGETVRFIQQSSASSILNRVTGGDMSRILGTLQSNGKVFLVNPNGIVMGQGSVIDVAGLVASSLNMTDADFLAGRLRFNADRSNPGSVTNSGEIRTPDGGFVYLVAPQVENSGVINTPGGEAVLAAGHSVELVDSSDPALRVLVKATSDDINLSQLMTLSNGNVFSVLNSGKVSANTAVVGQNGKIQFRSAGSVQTTATSIVEARGDINLDGGMIRGFADTNGVYAGVLDVSGKNGGFVETSGHWIDVNQSQINARALDPAGKAGAWLLDPYNIDIVITPDSNVNIAGGNFSPNGSPSQIQNTTIQTQLDRGTDVFIDTFNTSGSEAGNINVNASITSSSPTAPAGGLTLLADGKVTVNQPININGALNILSDADNALNVTSFALVTTSGSPIASTYLNSAIPAYLRVGQVINDTSGNIPAGTVITAIDRVNNSITLNNSATTTSTFDFVSSPSGTDTSNNGGIDIRAALTASAVDLTSWSGGVEVRDMVTATGTGLGGLHIQNASTGDINIGHGSELVAVGLNALSSHLSVANSAAGGKVRLQAGVLPASITGGMSTSIGSAGNIEIIGGTAAGATASITSPNRPSVTVQSISASGDIILKGGFGNGANAFITMLNPVSTSQYVNAGGAISLLGGQAATGAMAYIYNQGSLGQQITAGTGILVQAAAGATAGSNNAAYIMNASIGAQKIQVGTGVTGTGTGGITVRAGDVGQFNYAEISSDSDQLVVSGGDITIRGGSGGQNNYADFYASSSGLVGQQFHFTNPGSLLNLQGGTGGTNNSATIVAFENQEIGGWICQDGCFFGNLVAPNDPIIRITGGTGTLNVAGISVESSGRPAPNQAIHANSISIQGGNGISNAAYIENFNTSGSQFVYLRVGESTSGSFNAIPTISVVPGTGDIQLTGGSGRLNSAEMRSAGTQEVWTAGNITIRAGTGTAVGGTGTCVNLGCNDAGIETGQGGGTYVAGGNQAIKFVGSGLALRVEGGASGQSNVARVASHGTTQSLRGWDVTGASSSSGIISGGGANHADNPAIYVTGGAAGTFNDAGIGIKNDTANLQEIYAGSIAMTGGTGGGAYIKAERATTNFATAIAQNIYVMSGLGSNYGTLTMTSAGGDGQVGIGSDRNNSSITINTGSLTMNGASQRAQIGAIGYQGGGVSGTGNNASVTLNLQEGGDMVMNGANSGIGSELGNATVVFNANAIPNNTDPANNSTFFFNGGAIGTAKPSSVALGTNNSVSIFAGAFGGGINQSVSSFIRTGNLDAHGYGGGIALIGDNVVTDGLTAIDHGKNFGAPFGNVVVNLTNDSANIAAIPVLPSTVILNAFGGANAQLGIIGNFDTTGLGTWSIGSNVPGDTANASIFATGDLNINNGVALNGTSTNSAGAGGTLSVGSGFSAMSGSSLSLVGPTVLNLSGPVNTTGTVNMSGNAVSVTSNVTGSSIVAITNSLAVTSTGSLISSGAVNLAGAFGVDISGAISGTTVSIMGGTNTVPAVLTLNAGGSITGSGLVDLSGSAITLNGAVSGAGVSAIAGSTLTANTITSTGAINLAGISSVNVSGAVSGTTISVKSGTVAQPSALTMNAITGSGAVDLTGGTVSLLGNISGTSITAKASGDLTGASIAGSGVVDIQSGGAVTLTSPVSGAGVSAVAANVLTTNAINSTAAVNLAGGTGANVSGVVSGTNVSIRGGTTALPALLTVNSSVTGTGTVSLQGDTVSLLGSVAGTDITARATTALMANALNGSGVVDLAGGAVSLNGNVAGTDITAKAVGALTANSSITGSGAVHLNGNSIALAGSVTGTSIGIGATSTLQTSASISGAGTVSLVGSSVTVGGSVIGSSIDALANTLTVTGSMSGSHFSAKADTITVDGGHIAKFGGLLDIETTGNLTVTNSGSIIGDPDVDNIIVGGLVYLDNGGKIESISPASIYLTFPSLSTGGYIVDGVNGQITGPTGAGFYAGSSPAVLGLNLHVNYGSNNGVVLNFVVNELNTALNSMLEEQLSEVVLIDSGGGGVNGGEENKDEDKPRECSA